MKAPLDQPAHGRLLIGGTFAHQLVTATQSMPLDMLLTAGANLAVGDPFTLLRLPLGVSVGHQFQLDGGMAITPYVHPRLTYDRCGDCAIDGGAESDLAVDFDLGMDFRFTPQLSARLSATLGNSEFFTGYYDQFGRRYRDNALGIALAWTPRGARSTAAVTPKRSGARH